MHKNIEPSGITLMTLLLAIAILIALVIQSFVMRNIDEKINDFMTEDSSIYSAEQTIIESVNKNKNRGENPNTTEADIEAYNIF